MVTELLALLKSAVSVGVKVTDRVWPLPAASTVPLPGE
jgi:hypothetical protein